MVNSLVIYICRYLLQEHDMEYSKFDIHDVLINSKAFNEGENAICRSLVISSFAKVKDQFNNRSILELKPHSSIFSTRA